MRCPEASSLGGCPSWLPGRLTRLHKPHIPGRHLWDGQRLRLIEGCPHHAQQGSSGRPLQSASALPGLGRLRQGPAALAHCVVPAQRGTRRARWPCLAQPFPERMPSVPASCRLHGSAGTFSCMTGDIVTSCNRPYKHQIHPLILLVPISGTWHLHLKQHTLQSICRVGQKTYQASQDCLVLSRLRVPVRRGEVERCCVPGMLADRLRDSRQGSDPVSTWTPHCAKSSVSCGSDMSLC